MENDGKNENEENPNGENQDVYGCNPCPC